MNFINKFMIFFHDILKKTSILTFYDLYVRDNVVNKIILIIIFLLNFKKLSLKNYIERKILNFKNRDVKNHNYNNKNYQHDNNEYYNNSKFSIIKDYFFRINYL